MKKKLFLMTFLGLWFSQRPAFAHKEWVHQYMVQQSYLYLEQQIGPVPALRDAIGLNFRGRGLDSRPFNNSYPIGIGAWREDSEDPVYGYGGTRGFTPSITHFWDADNPNENYESTPLNIGYTSKAPNAWEKARVYLFCQDRNGAHDVTIPFVMPGEASVRNYIITYTSLPELYKGNYFLEGISNADGSGRVNYYLPQFNPGFGQPVALQLLGRVAHLLGDMSVPAHTHSHLHPCPANRPDHYEQDMGNTYYSNNNLGKCEDDPGGAYPAQSWTAATAAQQGGLLTDIHCLPSARDKAKYLFYTMNQLADFFPSGVNYGDMGTFNRGGDQSFMRGDNDLSQGSNPYITGMYSSYGWVPPTSINTTQIANVTFNFSIRAVATLFQWFAFEAGITRDLKNQQIANYSGSDMICTNAFFDVNSAPSGTDVQWTAEPAHLVTTSTFTGPMNRPVLNLTANGGAQGLVTVKASYTSNDGCYSGPVALQRQVWVGAPNMVLKKAPATELICPGITAYFEAGVARPSLEGPITYQWSCSLPGSSTGTSATYSVIAPNRYDVPVSVSCTMTNACGLSSTLNLYYTTANPNGSYFTSTKQKGDKLRVPCDNTNPGGVYNSGGYYRTTDTTNKPDGNNSALDASNSPQMAIGNEKDEVSVFPNPSNMGFELVVPPAALFAKGPNGKLLTLHYTLRDNLGRVMKEGTSSNTSIQIDTRALTAGIYSLSCSLNGKTFHKRVQVLH
ncbi:T9SS type A sorting domain-containing protein [Hymenobacter rubripertinctus]|uniref:T9SS C-terminal target domain-containing protein n=1 Tax=Hymenobacter rubripertinctus TaxID=2029981 RepID=A0A418R1X4_9BACT|nr:T9SS type A sorting domain-containing protein [Hymenobacter rubripertinctus]RIY11371.1 T9SS C-terminal target domain-containing protein [Hymenobacter rubripertinctus]